MLGGGLLRRKLGSAHRKPGSADARSEAEGQGGEAMSDKCRSCGADIFWVITTGKRMPLDLRPSPDGNLYIVHQRALSATDESVLRTQGCDVKQLTDETWVAMGSSSQLAAAATSRRMGAPLFVSHFPELRHLNLTRPTIVGGFVFRPAAIDIRYDGRSQWSRYEPAARSEECWTVESADRVFAVVIRGGFMDWEIRQLGDREPRALHGPALAVDRKNLLLRLADIASRANNRTSRDVDAAEGGE